MYNFNYKNSLLKSIKESAPGFQAMEDSERNLAFYMMPLSFVAATISMVLVIFLIICSAER
jgi:hypothetical protein